MARGDAELGFQQVSELIYFKELDFVGTLPDEVQQTIFFSAGIVADSSQKDLARQFDDIASARPAGHTFVQLEVEPFTAAEQKLEQPPFDGPELKYRFARQVERESGADVIGYRI